MAGTFEPYLAKRPPGAMQLGLIMPNKVHGCISHGPEMKPSKRYGQKVQSGVGLVGKGNLQLGAPLRFPGVVLTSWAVAVAG